MSLKITEQESNGITTLALDGRLVLGEETNSFRNEINKLLAAGRKKIVLDVAHVTYIDSSGVGALAGCYHSATSKGASLKLANLGNRFREILQVTRLLTIFETYDSGSAAAKSFSA